MLPSSATEYGLAAAVWTQNLDTMQVRAVLAWHRPACLGSCPVAACLPRSLATSRACRLQPRHLLLKALIPSPRLVAQAVTRGFKAGTVWVVSGAAGSGARWAVMVPLPLLWKACLEGCPIARPYRPSPSCNG